MKKLFDIAISIDLLVDAIADPAICVTHKAMEEYLGVSMRTVQIYVATLKDLGAEIGFSRRLGLYFLEPFDFWAAYRDYCRNAPV